MNIECYEYLCFYNYERMHVSNKRRVRYIMGVLNTLFSNFKWASVSYNLFIKYQNCIEKNGSLDQFIGDMHS